MPLFAICEHGLGYFLSPCGLWGHPSPQGLGALLQASRRLFFDREISQLKDLADFNHVA